MKVHKYGPQKLYRLQLTRLGARGLMLPRTENQDPHQVDR